MAKSIDRGSLWFRIFIIAPAIAIAAWITIWISAFLLSDRYFNAWVETEKLNGRNWLCARRTVHGFPLSFTMSCDQASVTAQTSGGRHYVALHQIDIIFSPIAPRSLRTRLSGPARFEDSTTQQAFDIQWDKFEIKLHYPWPSFPSAQTNVTNITVYSRQHSIESTLLTAGMLDLTIQIGSRNDVSGAILANILASNVAASLFDDATGNTQPLKLTAAFELSQVEKLLHGDLRSRLDIWRRSNGMLSIKQLAGDKGSLAIEASGSLSLDDQRRPAGRINMRAAGLTDLMQHLNLPGGISRGGILSGLLRQRNRNESESIRGPIGRFVPLPLTLRDGAVWIGPIKLPILLRPLI